MILEEALRNVAFALVRVSGFTANAILFGLPVVLLLAFRPALTIAPSSTSEAIARLAARLEGFVRAALCASLAASGLAIVLQSLVIARLGGGRVGWDALAAVAETSFGRWYLLRLPLLVALGILLVGKVRSLALTGVDEARPAQAPGASWWGAWIGLALGVLATSSFSGHAAVSSPLALALVNDVVHLAAGATWFAGIAVLVVVATDASRRVEQEQRVAFLAPCVARFSRVALVAIGVVVATGVGNSLFNVEAAGDLTSSGYGAVLLLKLTAFLGVVALGAINHLYVRRRLARAMTGSAPTSARSLFRKTIALELAFALLVLGLTGVLVGSARTRPSASSAEISPQYAPFAR